MDNKSVSVIVILGDQIIVSVGEIIIDDSDIIDFKVLIEILEELTEYQLERILEVRGGFLIIKN